MASGIKSLHGSGRSKYEANKTTLGLVFTDNRVRKVLPGGPAWVSGLREGDTIIAVDGREDPAFESGERLQTALSQTDRVGDKVHVKFRRDGRVQGTVIERASAERIKSIRDWMEKQAETATYMSDQKDAKGMQYQKELLDGMIQILIEQKMFEDTIARRMKQLASLTELHLDSAHELTDRLEIEAGLGTTRTSDRSEEERLRKLLVKGAIMKWMHRSKGRAWAKWHAEVLRTRRAKKAVKLWKNSLLARAWRAWGWAVAARKRMRVLAARALGRWKNLALAGALDLWRDQVARIKRLRRLMAKTVLRWRNLVIGRCFSKWYSDLLKKRKAAKAAKMWLNRCAGRALNSWVADVIRARRARRTLRLWIHRHYLQAWNGWQDFLLQRQRMRAIAQRALARWKNRALAGAIDSWCDAVARVKKLRLLMAKTVLRWRNLVVGRCFSKWYNELVRTRKAKKAARMWRNRLIAMGWRGWNASVAETKRLRAVAAKVVAHWKHRLLAGAWNRWLQQYQQLKKARILALRILKRWRNRALGRCWEKWHQNHLIFAQAKQIAARALRRWLNAILSRCFQKWSPQRLWMPFLLLRMLVLSFLLHSCGGLCDFLRRSFPDATVICRCHEVKRRRIAARAAANFMRKALCSAWRTWEDAVLWEGRDAVCRTCHRVGGRQVCFLSLSAKHCPSMKAHKHARARTHTCAISETCRSGTTPCS